MIMAITIKRTGGKVVLDGNINTPDAGNVTVTTPPKQTEPDAGTVTQQTSPQEPQNPQGIKEPKEPTQEPQEPKEPQEPTAADRWMPEALESKMKELFGTPDKLVSSLEEYAKLKSLEEKVKGVEDVIDVVAQDDKLREMLQYYKTTGNLEPWLEVRAIDYDKLSPEEVLRRSIKKQVPDLQEDLIDALVEKTKRDCGVTPETTPDSTEYRIFLAEVERRRSELKKEAERFQLPKMEPKNTQNEPDINPEELEKLKGVVESHPATSQLRSGTIKVTHGDVEAALEVANPEEVLQSVFDVSKLLSLFINADGQVDLPRYYETFMYAKDPEGFKKALIGATESKMTKKLVSSASGDPTSEPTQSPSEPDDVQNIIQAIRAAKMRDQ